MTNASGIAAGVSAGSEGTMVAIGAEVHDEVADAPFDIDEDEAAWRAQVAGFAHSVCAFDPAVFEDTDDEDSEQTVALAAGALVLASTMLIDEELEDIATLKQQAGTVASNGEMFLALGELPPRFANGYDGRFARKFLVATVIVIGRLSAPRWEPPACTAEALALHLVVRRAGDLLVDHGCLDEEQARSLYAGFEDAAFEDTDFERLYVDDLEETAGAHHVREAANRQSWFEPTSEQPVHVFTVQDDVKPGE